MESSTLRIQCPACDLAFDPAGAPLPCWWCGLLLCPPCWQDGGHCGHPESTEIARLSSLMSIQARRQLLSAINPDVRYPTTPPRAQA